MRRANLLVLVPGVFIAALSLPRAATAERRLAFEASLGIGKLSQRGNNQSHEMPHPIVLTPHIAAVWSAGHVGIVADYQIYKRLPQATGGCPADASCYGYVIGDGARHTASLGLQGQTGMAYAKVLAGVHFLPHAPRDATPAQFALTLAAGLRLAPKSRRSPILEARLTPVRYGDEDRSFAMKYVSVSVGGSFR